MDLRHVLDDVGSDDFDEDAVSRVRRRVTGEFVEPVVPRGAAPAPGRARSRGPRRVWLPTAIAVAAVACIIAGVAGVVASRPGVEVAAGDPSPTWQPLGDYRCGEVTIAGGALADPMPASQLGDERARILHDAAPEIVPGDWIVGSQAGGELLLLARAQTADDAVGDVTFARVTSPDESGVRSILTGRCLLARDVPNGEAVAFDVSPDTDPDANVVMVTVETTRCQPKADDYRVWSSHETSDAVEVTVAQIYSAQIYSDGVVETSCLPLDPREFELTVELDQPLGARTVIDVGHAHARDVFRSDAPRIDPPEAVAAAVAEPAAGAGDMTCGQATITAEGLESATTVDDVHGFTAEAVLSAGLTVDGGAWRLVEDTPERVRVLHVLSGDDAELYEFTRLTVFGGLTYAWTDPFVQNCDLLPADR